MAHTTASLSANEDAKFIHTVVQAEGISDYESVIIKRLLESANRFVRNIIDDAQLSANYSKKAIDVQDVADGIKKQSNKNLFTTQDKELAANMTKSKNSVPQIPSSRMRLPPSCNYRLKSPSKKPQAMNCNVTNLSTNGGS